MKLCRKRIIPILIIAAMLPIPSVFAGVVNDNKIPEWTITSSNSNSYAEVDSTQGYSGVQSLKLINKTEIGPNRYMIAGTYVPVEKGKTYRYGLVAKAERATAVSIMIDWGTRYSLLPLGGNYDWTEFELEYTHTTDAAAVSINILFDNTVKGYWIDDVRFYECKEGKKIGNNLVKNSSFEPSAPTNQGAKVVAGDGSVEKLFNTIKKSDSFSQEDISKVMGGFKYTPVFPADNLAIDGDLEDWGSYPPIYMPILSNQYRIYMNDGKPYDVTGWYKLAYDDEKLYIAIEVTDDTHFSIEGGNYWQGDSLQVALSQSGEKYGDEIGFMHNGETGTTGVFSYDRTKVELDTIAAKSKQSGDKTIYEMSIPWKMKYGNKPENLLFNILINDNDGTGRRYCVELAPGISEGKDNTLFPNLELMNNRKDWYAWLEVPQSVEVDENSTYSLYIVNNGDEKSFKTKLEPLEIEKEIKIPSKTGVRQEFTIAFDKIGESSIEAVVSARDIRSNSKNKVKVIPSLASFHSSLEMLNDYVKEIKTLLDLCESQKISTDYETINYVIIKQFIEYLKDDIEQKDYDRMAYSFETLTELYSKAKTSLEAYLTGAENPRTVPRYITSDVKIDGQSLIAKTDRNGVIEERPVFLIGYGHFGTARDFIPVFQKFGVNVIQNEIGPSSVIFDPKNVEDWNIVNSGQTKGGFTLDKSIVKDGSYSLKITNSSPLTPNVYIGMMQNVSVKPNTAYTFGCSAKAHNASGVWMSANGYLDRNSLDGTYDWKDFEFEFTTGADASVQNFVFLCENITGELYLDNIFMREGGKGENLLRNPSFEAALAAENSEYSIRTGYIAPIIQMLKDAEQSNIAVSLLISPHYFPQFMMDKYPELAFSGGGFLKYNVLHPKAKELIEDYIRTLIPMIKDFKSLNNICISNEPVFASVKAGDFFKPAWTDFLNERFEGDIDRLNKAYGSNYGNFEDVAMPVSMDPLPIVNDYKIFNDKIFASWHQWMADIIHELAPNIPLYSKVMGYTSTYENSDKRDFLFQGTDYENFAKFLDLNGNDYWNWPHDSVAGALVKTQWYDMQTSIKNAPVVNGEDHIIRDRDDVYTLDKAKHVEADIWQGAIHGRAMSTIWLWERTHDKKHDAWGSILYRPDCIKAVGDVMLDTNRLAYEITALQKEEPDIAILYSNNSRVYSTEYLNTVYEAYQSAMFNGKKIIFVTENQIEKLNGRKLLIVPGAKNVQDATFSAIERYAEGGGKVLMLGEDCLSRDENNQPRDADLVNMVKSSATVIPTKVDNFRLLSPSGVDMDKVISDAIKDAGISYITLIDVGTGQQAKRVEFASTVYEGKLIVNLCNYEWDAPKKLQILVNGKPVGGLISLRRDQAMDDVFVAEPYSPILISAKIDNPFFDTYGAWAEADISAVFAKGLVKGITETSFVPENQVTKAEFLTLVARTIGLGEKEYNAGLKDINLGDWYAKTVQAALDAGILNGLISDSSFLPNTPITREEMCTLLVRAYEMKKGVEAQKSGISFTDENSISQDRLKFVEKAYGLSLITGKDDGRFAPMDGLTRAEAAAVINRLAERL